MKKQILIILTLLIFSNSIFCMERSLYNFQWLDEDEQVYVIQNKEFTKKGRFGFDLGVGKSENSPYYDSTAMFFTGTYHFTENYSIDVTYKKYSNTDSQDLKNLLEANTSETKPLLTTVDTTMIVHLNWIPFYGKLNVFNKILYFDLGLGFGVGTFSTKNNFATFNILNKPLSLDPQSETGFNTKLYFKFFTNNKITFGFAYNLSAFKAIRTYDGTKELHFYGDTVANIGYIF